MRNQHEIKGNEVVIRLKCSRCGWLDCFINTQDLEKLTDCTWYANPAKGSQCRKHYATGKKFIGGGKSKTILMHREIVNPPEGTEVNHKDNDGLNNRTENLHYLKHIENMRWGKIRDWEALDRLDESAKEYRLERQIAYQIQVEFGITRQGLFKIRTGRVNGSPAAVAYQTAVKRNRIRPYELLRFDCKGKFGIYRKTNNL